MNDNQTNTKTRKKGNVDTRIANITHNGFRVIERRVRVRSYGKWVYDYINWLVLYNEGGKQRSSLHPDWIDFRKDNNMVHNPSHKWLPPKSGVAIGPSEPNTYYVPDPPKQSRNSHSQQEDEDENNYRRKGKGKKDWNKQNFAGEHQDWDELVLERPIERWDDQHTIPATFEMTDEIAREQEKEYAKLTRARTKNRGYHK